jgi:glycosyltransferase involved in cell wall biosynthesis
VAADQVMPSAAADSDVGLFTPPLDTEQRSLSLPNKLFEYIGAGLAVIVTPGDDLKEIVLRHGVGAVTADDGLPALVAALDALTPERVASFRQAARRASAELCWEVEQEQMAAILRRHLA